MKTRIGLVLWMIYFLFDCSIPGKFCMHYINGQTVYASVSDGLAMNDLCWLDMAHFPALCIALDYM